jgi:hypothetical protein
LQATGILDRENLKRAHEPNKRFVGSARSFKAFIEVRTFFK